MNANKNFIKTKYTFNEFLTDFTKIYPSDYIEKYMKILESYSSIQNTNLSRKTYQKINDEIFQKYQSLHPNVHQSLFQLYFQTLFPKPTSTSISNIHQLIEEFKSNTSNLKKKTNTRQKTALMSISHDNENSNTFNFTPFITFPYDIKIIHHNSNVLIQLQHQTNSNLKIEYTWGSQEVWNSLFPRLQIKEEDVSKLLHDKQPLGNASSFYEERKINELMQNLHTILDYLQENKPSSSKLSLESPHNQSLQKVIQTLLSKKNNSISDPNFQNIQNCYTIFQYIQKNIYPFIIFNTETYLKISLLNRKLFYHFFQQPQFEKIFPHTNKITSQLKPLPWIHSYEKEDIVFILMIMNLFSLLFELYEISNLSSQDMILSLILHQYSPYLLENLDMSYRIRYLIPIYYRNKYAFIQFLQNYPKKKKVEYPIYLITPNGLFVDFIYEYDFPYDPLLRERSLIVPETFYSEISSLQFYLLQILLIDNLKKLSIMNPILYKIFRKVLNKSRLPTFIKSISLSSKELVSSSDVKSQIEYIHSSKLNKWKFQHKAKLMNLPNQNSKKKVLQKGGDFGLFHEIPSDLKDSFNIIELSNLNPHFKKPTEYAYASLLYGNNPYFLETMTFGFSLYISGTTYDRILFITEDVPQIQREQLARFFNRIFLIQSLEVDPAYFFQKDRWYGVFNKIYGFYLDEYKKLIMLDTDMIVLKNQQQPYCPLDSLFTQINRKFAAMCYEPDYILQMDTQIPPKLVDQYLQQKNIGACSAGTFMIQPSKVTFYDMVRKLKSSSNAPKNGYKFPEEGFLSAYFKNEMFTIPANYNYAINFFKSDPQMASQLKTIPYQDIHILHFGNYKMYNWVLNPVWSIFDNGSSTYQQDVLPFKQLWILYFMQMEDLCSRPTYGTVYPPILFIRDFCNFPK